MAYTNCYHHWISNVILILAENYTALTTESGYEMETDSLGTTSKQPKIRNNPDKRGDDKYEGKGFASIITRHLNENSPHSDEVFNDS